MDLELVNRNVASRPKGLPPATKRTPRTWTAEQVGEFLRSTANDRLAPLWRFFAVTGCRRGEALGLRWAEVDLDGGTATIVRQRTIAGGSVVEGAPKTGAGARTVALDAGTIGQLRSWRSAQAAERLLMGAGWANTGLVFTHADGRGLWPQTVTRRFGQLSETAGLPSIGVHGLRHSVATHLIARGVNPRVVQQRLGHAHVSVTLGLYTHVLPAHDREAAASLADAIDGAL
jgi:integrase